MLSYARFITEIDSIYTLIQAGLLRVDGEVIKINTKNTHIKTNDIYLNRYDEGNISVKHINDRYTFYLRYFGNYQKVTYTANHLAAIVRCLNGLNDNHVALEHRCGVKALKLIYADGTHEYSSLAYNPSALTRGIVWALTPKSRRDVNLLN